MNPVHSPAPLSTAPPAGTGRRYASSASSSVVTPVRATPRPEGGGGSSRWTVACPRPTPGTSSTEFVGPVGRAPMTTPRSRARGMPASCRKRSSGGWDAGSVSVGPVSSMPVVWSPDTRRHDPKHEIWVGVPSPGTEVAARVDAILDAVAGHPLVEADSHGAEALQRVHDPELVAFLASVHDR